MKIRIRIGYVLIGTTYMATELSILFGCRPFHKNWQINPDPGSTIPAWRPPLIITEENYHLRSLSASYIKSGSLCDGGSERPLRSLPYVDSAAGT